MVWRDVSLGRCLRAVGIAAAPLALGFIVLTALGLLPPGVAALTWLCLTLISAAVVYWLLGDLLQVKNQVEQLARGEESDRVRGLDYGADDYIVKPFSPSELVARVRAVLRRLRPAFEAEIIQFGDVTMSLAEFRVMRGGDSIRLAPTEFRLLRHFIEHPGRVFSREQLLDAVWGREIYLEPRTVDVHVRCLRKTLNAGGKQDIIRTVRAAGYAIAEQA